ncbi:hypothetical protein [Legionella shakespearei]|uniref:Transmembrane protein n=1 Tax=Legionella shakespearei DSM 23087 TaxID=1122169 RepID=A0A0W0YZQ9_9GAMM|nr:hypothetical protein [Legionella shakespearei]KTD62362.1 hypothetical protein Lsha_1062 [Legionella shakespearei DSM 23087]
MQADKKTWVVALIGVIVALIYVADAMLELESFIFVVFPVLVGLLFALSYDGKNNLQLLASSIFVALVLSVPFRVDGNATRQINPGIFYSILVYMVHCFHYAYHHNGSQWSFKYSLLFEAAWNTFFVLIIATLFMLASFQFVYYISLLLNSIENPLLFMILDQSRVIATLFMIILFFIGVAIAQSAIDELKGFRTVLLKSMNYCLPFLVFSVIVYFIFFWFSNNQSANVIVTAFLILIAISFLFLNLYYQDGKEEYRGMDWLTVILQAYKVLLLVMILIACYYAFGNLSLAFHQIIYLTIALFLGWVYAYSSFFSDEKAQQIIEDGNKGLAIVFIVAIYIALLPYSPVNFTVNKGKTPLSLWDGAEFILKFRLPPIEKPVDNAFGENAVSNQNASLSAN